MPYSASGEHVDPSDVLDAEEMADYLAAQRDRYSSFRRPPFRVLRTDELGYDRDGNWHSERDGTAS